MLQTETIAPPAEYDIKEYFITLRDDVVDVNLAAQALVLIVRSLGKSPVSEVETHIGYDLDDNTYSKTHLKVRYIDVAGLKMLAPKTATTVKLERRI